MNHQFDKAFVMNATARRLISCINFSISKTVRRIRHFEGDPDKSIEILMTLSELNDLKQFAESILNENPYEANDDVV